MEIVAPLSKHKRNSLIIMIVAIVGFAVWCVYDGYINTSFIEEHTDAETGKPNETLVFNQKGPPFMLLGAALIGGYWFLIRKRCIVATDTELVINGKIRILYDDVQAIDKTHFENKGFFHILHTRRGKEVKTRIDDRQYDKLQPILDHLIAQIT
jgi:hypothetical protein